jgi:hypothetical protein
LFGLGSLFCKIYAARNSQKSKFRL